jgi:RNA polymerase sigma factor (sigma-70 family)
MDEVLLPYLQATSEAEKQRCLDELLLVHASPVVRNTLRERLGIHVSLAGSASRHQEAEDLYHEILAKIIELVRTFDTADERTDIRSFRRYVARVATNACHDYFRRKSPARARLKNNLRDLLARHPDFALWKVDEDWFAGFANWPATKDVITASQRDEVEGRLHAFRAEVFPGEDVSQLPLSRLVAELFRWFDAAVELDLLVNLIARLLGIKDHLPESLDDESKRYLEARLSESTFSVNLRLDAKDILVHLWDAVRSLPINQRDTFCLSFSDQSGEDLFSLLIDAEVASFEEIARALGRAEAELAELWSEMPMDRTKIAVALKATPPQVSKWRFRAVARLERQMFSPK